METCENCGRKIGNLEEPWVWDDRVVCRGCHEALSDNAKPAMPAGEGGAAMNGLRPHLGAEVS